MTYGMEILGREVGSSVADLYAEITTRWLDASIDFVREPELGTEGAHRRGENGESFIHLRDDADDEVIFHELLHDYFYRLGCPSLSLLITATGGYALMRDLIEIRVSHPFVHEEMRRRGFERQAFWQQTEAGILGWQHPEPTSPTNRLREASVIAEFLTCSHLDPAAISAHASAQYPATWALAGRVVPILTPAKRTLLAWRQALVAMIALAQEIATEEGARIPLSRLLTVSPVLTPADQKRTARRLLDVEVVPDLGLVAVVSKRDGSMFELYELGEFPEVAGELAERLFLSSTAFFDEIGVRWAPDQAI